MSGRPGNPQTAQAATVGLADVLLELSGESNRLVTQCGSIQQSISAILDIVHHPDLRAEVHMLQDIDRIQQTLADIAAILSVIRGHVDGPPIEKDEIGSVIRLESLRLRLGLSNGGPDEGSAPETSDITWL